MVRAKNDKKMKGISFCYQIIFYSLIILLLGFKCYAGFPNVSTEIKAKWLLNAAIPFYLRDFVNGINTKANSAEVLQVDWFNGVEPKCRMQMVDWISRLKMENLGDLIKDENKWVLQMVDAWGKIPEGIMSGHVSSYGDFDQCIQTEATVTNGINFSEPYQFSGMYCSSYLLPLQAEPMQTERRKMSFKMNDNGVLEAVSLEQLLKLMANNPPSPIPLTPSLGTCFPNGCTGQDVSSLLINGMTNFYSKLPIENPGLYLFPMACSDKNKPKMDAGAIVVIVVIAILIGLAVVAACVDYWQQHYSKESTLAKNKVYQYLMAFSLYTNSKKLFSTRRSAEDLGCLHGIRFLSTAWVVLAHTHGAFVAGPLWNLIDINKIYLQWTNMAVINGSYSVDTFFLMSGMLATYNILKMLDKTKGKINIIMLYVHRYIRLTPMYAVIIGISATLIFYAGNGPFWWVRTIEEDYCRKNWWTNLLYINNLLNTDEMCNGEAWYLPNDMQFFILSPFIVYPLWKWKKVGIALLGAYTVLSCISPVLVMRYAHDVVPANIVTRPNEGAVEIYARPWSRINVFLVGVWLGWLLHVTKGQKVTIPRTVVLALWMASTATALAVIFGIKPWFDPQNEIPDVAGYFYAGLSRFSFSVAVAWVIFSCLKGYGGIINEFLSWKAFMPLGRLCFSVYLVSVHLQVIFHARLTVPIKWDTYTIVNLYFAHMVMSYLIGYLFTVFFESPFVVLQKLIFESPAKDTKPKSNSINKTEDK